MKPHVFSQQLSSHSVGIKSVSGFLTAVLLASSVTISHGLAAHPFGGSTPAGIQFTPTLIADVAEAIAPSVVNIDVESSSKVTNAALPDISGLPFSDQVLKRFFGWDPNTNGGSQFSPFENGNGSSQPLTRVIKANGSGMIMDQAGYILTNNHVISTADKITVTLNDARRFPARLIGRDQYADIAVIKIDAPNLKSVILGDSEHLRPGEWVIAVGSPLGFDHTVTQGIVSALSRRIPDLNSNLSFIQTDAAINPGNSGGPLANLKGEVIGINTAISGKGQNIGFAIPINTVKEIANTLIAGKPVVRPYIGVSLINLSPELAKHIGLEPDSKGVVIAKVVENSPAYKAGLMQKDVIQKIDGRPMQQAEEIQEALRSRPPETKFTLSILRNGHPIDVAIVSETLPDEPVSEGEPAPGLMPGKGSISPTRPKSQSLAPQSQQLRQPTIIQGQGFIQQR